MQLMHKRLLAVALIAKSSSGRWMRWLENREPRAAQVFRKKPLARCQNVFRWEGGRSINA